MAPPPAHLIFRRVVKNYVRSLFKYELKDTEELAKKMEVAEEAFGEDSEQYAILSTQFDRMDRLEERYRGHIYRMRLHTPVMRLLVNPKRKKEGKNGELLFARRNMKFELKGIY